jgi:RND family efflux transporter MFP subunit
MNRKLWIALVVMLILAIVGISARAVHEYQLRRTTRQAILPAVSVIQAQAGSATEELVLPGSVQGWHSTTIFARTNGYTIRWLVDIGASVKAGQLLAVIASPEIDAQLRQAQANLKAARVNNALAQRTAKRWRHLLKTHSVSKQETDEKVTSAKASAAMVAAARANRDRLRVLVGFERVVAPFDGIITSRTVDIGRLIAAGPGSVPLFRIVQSNPLRIYVSVPQYYSLRIRPDVTASLYFREHPDRRYPARLLNNARAIDANTRTLLTQLAVDNPHHELMPGSYTEVHFTLPGASGSVRLPVNTLIFRSQGLQVATLDQNNQVVFKSIQMGRDFGDAVEVVAGLNPGETVILSPPSTLNAGEKVKVVTSS